MKNITLVDINKMTIQELQKELEQTEKFLDAIFEESKYSDDPELNRAFYEYQNDANRIRNRLYAMEGVKA